MPRPPRIERKNGLYHVTSRGNGRARIFYADEDRLRFLEQLADSLESYEVMVYAYVLMDNHFHLLARTPQANLSRFMQRLLTSYALYLGYKRQRPGHQFQGRFKAKLIEGKGYLRQVSRYVHLNPVKTKACARLSASQRLERLRRYRWSSYLDYVSARGGGVEADGVWPAVALDALDGFGKDRAAARKAYRQYVRLGLERDDEATRVLMGASAYAIGSDEFIESVRSELMARREGKARDDDVALPRPRVAVGRIDAAVAKEFGVDPIRLRQHGNKAGDAKKVAVELARQLTGWTQRRVGQHYGGIRSQSVGQIARQLRESKHAAPLRETIERLKNDMLRKGKQRRNLISTV